MLKRFPEWDVDWSSAKLSPTSTVRGWESIPVVTHRPRDASTEQAPRAVSTTARCGASARPRRASASSPPAPSCCTASRSGTGRPSPCARVAERAGVNERTVYRLLRERARAARRGDGPPRGGIGRRPRRARARRHRSRTPRGSSSTCRRSRSSRARRTTRRSSAAHRRQREALLAARRADTAGLVRRRPRRRGRRCSTCCGASCPTNGSSSTGSSTRRTRSRRHLGHRSGRGRRPHWSPAPASVATPPLDDLAVAAHIRLVRAFCADRRRAPNCSLDARAARSCRLSNIRVTVRRTVREQPMSTSTTPVEFDPFSDDFFNDPTEMYRRLRDEAPVYFSEKYGFYALSRFADVLAAHRDWEGFSSAHGIELFSLSKDPERSPRYRQIIMMDPPEHDRFRALVSRVFTPRAVTSLEPMIREVISGYLDPLTDATDFDAVADFSAPFPVEMISRMLGVPDRRTPADPPLARHQPRSASRARSTPSPESEQAVIEQGMYLLRAHGRRSARTPATTCCRGSRRSPSTGATAGDRARRPRDRRIRHPARRRRCGNGDEARRQRRGAVRAPPRPVAEDPRRPREHPAARSRRSCGTGRRRSIRVGTRCRSVRSRAARCPRASPCCSSPARPRATRVPSSAPDDFDVERPPGITIGFGHGVHSCLGAALARMESRIAIEELANRWTRLDVDEAGLRRVNMSNVAGYSNVPVRAVSLTTPFADRRSNAANAEGAHDDRRHARGPHPRSGRAHLRAGGVGVARRLGRRGHQDRARRAGRRHARAGVERHRVDGHDDVHVLLEHSNRGKQSLCARPHLGRGLDDPLQARRDLPTSSSPTSCRACGRS